MGWSGLHPLEAVGAADLPRQYNTREERCCWFLGAFQFFPLVVVVGVSDVWRLLPGPRPTPFWRRGGCSFCWTYCLCRVGICTTTPLKPLSRLLPAPTSGRKSDVRLAAARHSLVVYIFYFIFCGLVDESRERPRRCSENRTKPQQHAHTRQGLARETDASPLRNYVVSHGILSPCAKLTPRRTNHNVRPLFLCFSLSLSLSLPTPRCCCCTCPVSSLLVLDYALLLSGLVRRERRGFDAVEVAQRPIPGEMDKPQDRW